MLVMFFYAHRLLEADYGHYQSFWVQLNVFNVFMCVGITIFSVTYPPEKIRALFQQIHPKYYVGYFIFLIIGGVLFGWLQNENSLSIYWPALFLPAFAFCNISDALLIVFRKFKLLTILNFVFALLFFGIHFHFLRTPFRFNSLLQWILLLLLAKLIFSAWILIRHNQMYSVRLQKPASGLKNMLSLWRHLYFYDILQVSSLWIDKFIISLFMNSKETAVYINGTLSIPFLPILFSAVTSAALIHLSNKNQPTDRLKIARHVGKVLSAVAFPVTIFLIFFRTKFIVFCFSAKYLDSVPIFLCSLFIIPFRAYGHTMVLQSMEQGKIINQGAILELLIALALMYPLYLWLGLPGVALSFVFSTFIQALFYGIQTKKLLKVSLIELYPVANWLLKALLFLVIGWLLYHFLPNDMNPSWRLLSGFGVMAALSVSCLLFELRKRGQEI